MASKQTRIAATFINRNPRNLELLRIEPKRRGWEFQFPTKEFWNKCTLVRSDRHTTAHLEHKNGTILISASTKEHAISRHLHAFTDVAAARNVGRVLAQRCLQCGFGAVFFDETESPLESAAMRAFHAAMLEAGVVLQEPPQEMTPPQVGIDYDRLTAEERRALYPSLIENLRSIPDWGQFTYPYSLRPVAGLAKMHNRYQALRKVREGLWFDRFYKKMLKDEELTK